MHMRSIELFLRALTFWYAYIIIMRSIELFYELLSGMHMHSIELFLRAL